eukprot:gnl/TRDRNA2_/TRDRNA2_127699_c1_seq1.p2 gnl/TRDRNA2_/TRDRNA2_127699_c1~~gnl/TRDRNA2_/TRDRNA2_127699_c1_seq1.p2  ORF type:complete len:112 (-),score=2.32 gnl/TRDRNA2_/TRDRNA2_127699_c1_seq1:275-610(-)
MHDAASRDAAVDSPHATLASSYGLNMSIHCLIAHANAPPSHCLAVANDHVELANSWGLNSCIRCCDAFAISRNSTASECPAAANPHATFAISYALNSCTALPAAANSAALT